MSYQHILVAVDGSDISKSAFEEAVKLSKAFDADLRILSVVDEYPGYAEGIAIDLNVYKKSLREYGQAILNQMEEQAKQAGLDVDTRLVETDMHPDKIPEKIVDEADAWKADLIVIGTHGRRGVNRLLMGSVAESVARLANAPVLLVRGKKT